MDNNLLMVFMDLKRIIASPFYETKRPISGSLAPRPGLEPGTWRVYAQVLSKYILNVLDHYLF